MTFPVMPNRVGKRLNLTDWGKAQSSFAYPVGIYDGSVKYDVELAVQTSTYFTVPWPELLDKLTGIPGVYVLNIRSTDWIKIGYSDSLGRRIRDWQGPLPPCDLVGVLENASRYTEIGLHKTFKRYYGISALSREWFDTRLYPSFASDLLDWNADLQPEKLGGTLKWESYEYLGYVPEQPWRFRTSDELINDGLYWDESGVLE
jgi:hypothetical protein